MGFLHAYHVLIYIILGLDCQIAGLTCDISSFLLYHCPDAGNSAPGRTDRPVWSNYQYPTLSHNNPHTSTIIPTYLRVYAANCGYIAGFRALSTGGRASCGARDRRATKAKVWGKRKNRQPRPADGCSSPLLVTNQGSPRGTLKGRRALNFGPVPKTSRAGDGIRTHDSLLGKQIRYHCVTPA
jgi:hypothetical protein